jgi:hypothetical protein
MEDGYLPVKWAVVPGSCWPMQVPLERLSVVMSWQLSLDNVPADQHGASMLFGCQGGRLDMSVDQVLV